MRVLLACLLAAFGTLGEASLPAAGTIAGVVRDPTGSTLPGVFVQVVPRTGRRLTTVTDERGVFRVANVPAGTVGVIYSLSSFTTLRHHRVTVGARGADSLLATMSVAGICECITNDPRPRIPMPRELTLDERFDAPLPAVAYDALHDGEVPLYLELGDGPVTLAIDSRTMPDVVARLIGEVERHALDASSFYRQSRTSELWHETRTDGWRLRLAEDSNRSVEASIGPIRYDDIWLRARVLSGSDVLREMRIRSFSGELSVPIYAVSVLSLTR